MSRLFFLRHLYLYLSILQFTNIGLGGTHPSRLPGTGRPHLHFLAAPQVSQPSPYFLRKFFFSANSASLSPPSQRALRTAARWLSRHPRERVLIIGLCDRMGSEDCNHALALHRGLAVEEFLRAQGVQASQIDGVLGWEDAGNQEGCAQVNDRCQRLNRTARLFIAGPLAPE